MKGEEEVTGGEDGEEEEDEEGKDDVDVESTLSTST